MSLPRLISRQSFIFFHLDKSEAKFGMDLPLLCSTIGVKSKKKCPREWREHVATGILRHRGRARGMALVPGESLPRVSYEKFDLPASLKTRPPVSRHSERRQNFVQTDA